MFDKEYALGIALFIDAIIRAIVMLEINIRIVPNFFSIFICK
tara:strand:+ start:2598 stop:2723 length:126 start_codon:yes stop_codon:yes gene_type:complete